MNDPSAEAASVDAKGLRKRFGPVVALDGVDLRVDRGESVALFGPNGAGKTTLVRILTLGLRPDAGRFQIEGRDPRREDCRARAQIGVISHQTFLYDDLTAHQNVAFFAGLYGAESPGKRASELLERFGVGHRADDSVGGLSRGLQQRVALARALVHDPPLIFLDEPFSGLDPYATALLRQTLCELRGCGRTILLVTHDLRQGLGLCDRWIVLGRGRLVGAGRSSGADPAALERDYFAGRGPRTGPRDPA